MRWPLVTRKRFDKMVDAYEKAVTAEYARALTVGRAQVHAWAVDANAANFYADRRVGEDPTGRAIFTQQLQTAEKLFAPPRAEIKA